MFLEHFNLREQPFGVTPNPRYVFECPGFREANANLTYAIESNLGFAALFAEPGMGKTTMLIDLLGRYGQDRPTAFISHTQCSSTGMLRMLLKDLEIETADRDPIALVEELKKLLIDSEPNKRPLIVIDEAQNLDHTTLETLRLLSNIESAESKLLNIILAGQLQFARKLLHPDLEQLKQRIAVIARLTRLTPAEVAGYINHRLTVAGSEGRALFTPRVMAAIAVQSGGIPRQINRICFHALSLACAMDKKLVDDDVLREVEQDLRLTGTDGVRTGTGPMHHPTAQRAVLPAIHRAPPVRPPEFTAPVPPQHFTAAPPPAPQPPTASTAGPSVAAPPVAGETPPSRNLIGFRDSGATARAAAAPAAEPHAEPFRRGGSVLDHPLFAERAAQLRHAQGHESAAHVSKRTSVFRPAWNRLNYRVLAICTVMVALLLGGVLIATRFQTVKAAVAGIFAPMLGSSEPAASVPTEPAPQPASSTEGVSESKGSVQKRTRASSQTSRSLPNRAVAGLPADSITETINLPPMNTESAAAPIANQTPHPEPAPPAVTASARPDVPVASLYLPPKSPEAITTAPLASKIEPPVALKQPVPKYPQIARTARMEGSVVLEAIVRKDGEVGDVRVVSGPPMLAQAAVDAVKQWKYKPATSGGEAVESPVRVEFKFVP